MAGGARVGSLSRETTYDECDWQADTEDMNDQLGEEGFGREFALWRGGERYDDATHYPMNRAAIDNTAEQRIVDEGRQLSTDSE